MNGRIDNRKEKRLLLLIPPLKGSPATRRGQYQWQPLCERLLALDDGELCLAPDTSITIANAQENYPQLRSLTTSDEKGNKFKALFAAKTDVIRYWIDSLDRSTHK